MDTLRKLSLLFAAALLAVALVATPVLAAEGSADVAEETVDDAEDDAEIDTLESDAEEEGRPALAETPRDRLGLILFGAMAAAGIVGWIGMRRQLGGEHSKATGEFRWR